MPLETSAEAPIPVRTVLRLVGNWIGRLGRVWVEGQVAELRRRGGAGARVLGGRRRRPGARRPRPEERHANGVLAKRPSILASQFALLT